MKFGFIRAWCSGFDACKVASEKMSGVPGGSRGRARAYLGAQVIGVRG